MDIGTIKKTSIEKNQDSDTKVIMLEVMESEDEDIQDVQLISLPGIKSRPETEVRTVILDFGGGLKISLGIEDGIETAIEEGELDLYSTSGSVRKASIYLKKDGTLILNDGTDYAVKYNELKSKIDDLKEQLNSFITTKYNLHNHPTAPVGAVSPPSIVGVEVTTDFASIKSDKVQLP
jgi:hypothetical protein